MKKPKPEKYTKEWFAEMGKRGGLIVKEKYGLNHYSKMGKKKVDKSKPKIKQVNKPQ